MAVKGQVFSGARARLLINSVKVGYATGCSGGETLTYERVKVLDNIGTKEHVPTDYDVRFTADLVRLVGETVKSQGIMPSLGANSDQHLTNILTSGALTIVIEDSQTGALIMTLEQARCTSNNFQINAVGIVGNSLEFVAVRMRDESET